jgi:hypothetical protein
MRLSRCRSCQALCIWAETEKGKRMLVDYDRVPHGNVRLVSREAYDEPLAIVLGKVGRKLVEAEHAVAFQNGLTEEEELLLHTPHWATCPHADKHRKAREVAA